jgi:lipopolysaccharide export system protein LptC
MDTSQLTAQEGEASPVSAAAKPRRRSALWQPRQTSVASSVAQYSRFVGYMKVLLPSAAGVLLLLIVALPQFRQTDDRFRIGMNLLEESTADTLNMTNARYYGTDEEGQPYSVTAANVRERPDDDPAVDLTAPQADISLTDGSWLSISARTGVYDRDQQKLSLDGNVALYQDQGNEFHTSSAHIDLEKGEASGSEPVVTQGPFGSLNAAGFSMSETGKVVYFVGPALLVLNSGETSGSIISGGSSPSGELGAAQ